MVFVVVQDRFDQNTRELVQVEYGIQPIVAIASLPCSLRHSAGKPLNAAIQIEQPETGLDEFQVWSVRWRYFAMNL